MTGDSTDEPGHDGEGYVHRSLDDLEPNADKPGRRWEISPQLGIDGYNVNVAVLDPGERLSENAYHYHRDQSEFYYVVAGRLRVETPDGGFDAAADDVVRFDAGVAHLLHNPFEASCKVLAVGHPSEGRYPVERVAGRDELLADRYGDDLSE